MRPFLSVVMPTYNGEKFLGSALQSVREQATDLLELIVVDDGSSDRTLEILRSFQESLPIRLITPGRIGNWVSVSNIGLREAKGDWACFLHQDDLWLPGRIASLCRALQEAKGMLIVHNAEFIGPDGRPLGLWTCPLSAGDVSSDEFLERLLIQNFIAMPSPAFLRSAAIETGGLDESLWFSADWDLWLRMGAMGQIRFIPEILTAFRLHSASQTVSRELLPGEWERQLTTVLRRHLLAWSATGKRRQKVERVARASIAVNATLATRARGQSPQAWAAFLQLISLGPSGLFRYVRDSRIVERVISRLRVERYRSTGAIN